jgi:hypothetical protein
VFSLRIGYPAIGEQQQPEEATRNIMKRPAEDQAPAGAAEAAGGAPAETNRDRKARTKDDAISRKEQSVLRAKADFFRGHALLLDSLDDSGRDKQREARRRHAENGTRTLAEIQQDMEVVSAPVSVPLPLSSGLALAVAGLFAVFVRCLAASLKRCP